MSPITWKPTVISPEIHPRSVRLWRMVPADRMQVVETLAEAQVLDVILGEYETHRSRSLHPLVADCFQIRLHADVATRFRASGGPGVFYGAGAIKTAAAEVAYWRHRFITRSTCQFDNQQSLHGVFHLDFTADSIDLRDPPFNSDAAWLHPNDYTASQVFAVTARETGVACIMYQSVRHPTPAMCAAVISPEPLAEKVPIVSRRSWELSITRQEAIWRQTPFGESFAFPIAFLTRTE